MKRELKRSSRNIGLVLLAALPLLAQNALAVGTPAGTTVQNTASATYSVGGVAQIPVASAPVTFEVDQRVDFTLLEIGSAPTTVTPGQNNAVTTFELTNLGNAPQDFALLTSNLAGDTVHGNADTVDVEDPPRVFVDTDGNGVYDGTETATFVDELTEDDSAGLNVIRIFVVANVGTTGINNGDFANVDLTATAHDGGAPGLGLQTTDDAGDADDPNVVQIVFADAGFDGVEVAQDGYAVQSAVLQVTKASQVVADEFGSLNPKAIPGSTVQYVVSLANNGPVVAQSVGIVDSLNANLTIALGEYGGAGDDLEYEVGAGPTLTCSLDTDDGDADGCGIFLGGTEVRAVPGGGVTLSDSGSAPANAAVFRFRVTIN